MQGRRTAGASSGVQPAMPILVSGQGLNKSHFGAAASCLSLQAGTELELSWERMSYRSGHSFALKRTAGSAECESSPSPGSSCSLSLRAA